LREQTFSVSKIADLCGCSHITARKRLTAAGAVAEPSGRYTLKAVLSSWERCAAGRVGVIDAAAAKLVLANLKIEAETIAIRRTKAELVEAAPWTQYMAALTKVLWGALQSLGMSTSQVDHCRSALNMATAEFIRGYPMHKLLTLEEQELYLEAAGKEKENEQPDEQVSVG
jgi:hypothetical protein